MSKTFLTRTQAAAKLETAGSGNEFVKKSDLLLMGADPDLLVQYDNNQYPIDDDVETNFIPAVFELSIDVHLSIGEHENLLSGMPSSNIGDIGKVIEVDSL